jgi:hypothetical protein
MHPDSHFLPGQHRAHPAPSRSSSYRSLFPSFPFSLLHSFSIFPSFLSLIFPFFLLSIFPFSVFSQWSTSPFINNPIYTGTGTQNNPQICSDGTGGAVITWQDDRNGSPDIYAQRVSALGVAQWTVPICMAAGDQIYPQICSDGTGGAVISWQDFRSGNYDIYAQRVNASGGAQWLANGVAICTATNNQYNPQICSDGTGGAIIPWQDLRSGSNFDIYAQRVNASGVVQWTSDGVAICTATNSQTNPQICSDVAGGGIITWFDYRSTSNYDIYAQRVVSGSVQWTANGVAICTATNNQYSPQICSDGAGGGIITWEDYRSASSYDIYAQRVASGSVQWTTDGVAVCTSTGAQQSPRICSDGTGGAVITWQDSRTGSLDIYAQRVASGSVQWTANGVAICMATNSQMNPQICSDGAGGGIITWEDYRSASNYDVYAQRIASGSVQWTADGVAISTATNNQSSPQICGDGVGGGIITWADNRSGNYDVYAQNVDRYGYLGIMAPIVANVQDVVNDQGGKVALLWNHSPLDSWNNQTVTSYRIYRGVRSSGALASYAVLGEKEYVAKESHLAALPRTYMVQRNEEVASSDPIYWEGIANFTAEGLETYNYAAPTLSDSGPQGNSMNYFMVRSKTASSTIYWDSQPDSGYSVDNLPPSTPIGGRVSVIAANSIRVSWEPNTVDPDVGYFAVYRSTTSGFTPSPTSLLGTTADTAYMDNAAVSGSAYYYRVTTVDIHGNQSTPTDELSLSFTRSLAAGWNMVSLPGSMPDAYYLTAYPGATTNSLYSFSGTYVLTDVLHLGTGYWLKYAATTNVTTNSAPVSSQSIALVSGWNMIGGPSCTIATTAIGDPSHVVVEGTFYGFERGYTAVNTLQRGKGYWVRTSGAGTITLTCGGTAKQTTSVMLANLSSLPALQVCDASGGEQTLYYNVSFNTPEEQLCYSLPPLPAEGCFDARFAGDYRAVQAGGGTIQVQSAHYPVTITPANVTSTDGAEYVLVEMEEGKEAARHVMASGVPIEIQNVKVKTLVLHKESALPLVFGLEQNYPNPFNPKSEIGFQVSDFSMVTLKVYDLLGREVATLVNEVLHPGTYLRTFDASGLASGVYVYRLSAGPNVASRKMLLTK